MVFHNKIIYWKLANNVIVILLVNNVFQCEYSLGKIFVLAFTGTLSRAKLADQPWPVRNPVEFQPMKPNAKSRLDCALVEKGIFDSRQKAQRAILAGDIRVNGQRVDKPGTLVPSEALLEARAHERYVSRGGYKLEAALAHFDVQLQGWTCVDVGASTGGFTDCLLQHGAAKVYAYDVGHAQLDWKIRSDPRVVVREKLNARQLTPADLPEPTRLGVIDVSFISLSLILPAVTHALAASLGGGEAGRGLILALIKPQFELERGDVGKGGIVREPELHAKAVEKIRDFVRTRLPEWHWTGVMDSPILGAAGNKEFLACLKN